MNETLDEGDESPIKLLPPMKLRAGVPCGTVIVYVQDALIWELLNVVVAATPTFAGPFTMTTPLSLGP
ncbi:MAG TPA: hypothetical protein VMQ86_07250 [Bryobacteraceae bacterium]|nr:hypothetical protein [Bryobacteraceae bacterium]